MSAFKVLAASVKKTLPDTGRGAKQVISLTLSDHMDQTKQAEWFTNANTPLPDVGSTLDGELEQGNYGLNFKKAGGFSGGGGGGSPYKQTHPIDAARMGRSHAQDMALSYMAIKASLGKVEDFKPSDLWELINWFDLDVKQAADKLAPPPQLERKDIERTGQSDVPSDGAEFTHPVPSPAPGEDPIPW